MAKDVYLHVCITCALKRIHLKNIFREDFTVLPKHFNGLMLMLTISVIFFKKINNTSSQPYYLTSRFS